MSGKIKWTPNVQTVERPIVSASRSTNFEGYNKIEVNI